jgi:hypothetical protein
MIDFSPEQSILFACRSTTSESVAFHPMFKARRKCIITSDGSDWLKIFVLKINQVNTQGSRKDEASAIIGSAAGIPNEIAIGHSSVSGAFRR